MNIEMTDEQIEMHDLQVQAVTRAVAKLLPNLAAQGFTPEAIFEGAIKGGAAQMIAARNCSTGDIADLLIDMAQAFNEVLQSRPNMVQ